MRLKPVRRAAMAIAVLHRMAIVVPHRMEIAALRRMVSAAPVGIIVRLVLKASVGPADPLMVAVIPGHRVAAMAVVREGQLARA